MKLEAVDLNVGYDAVNVPQRGISFALEAGDVCCVLGPNGCGKSTLFNTMLGYLPPRSGHVYVEFDKSDARDEMRREQKRQRARAEKRRKRAGDAAFGDLQAEQSEPSAQKAATEGGAHREDVHAMKASRRADLMAYVAQSHQPPFPYVTQDVVEMGLVNKVGPGGILDANDHKLVDQVMQEMGIWDLRNDVYTQLSGGELQLVLIARALVQQPKFILMDEPTAALDYGNEIRVIEQVKKLREQGIGVLMTTHNPDHAFLLDANVVLLSKDEPMKYGRCWDVVTDKALAKTYDTDVYRVQYETRSGGRMYLCVPDL